MERFMSRSWVRNGLIAAALANIAGVLLFSLAFTNPSINSADPVVMSNFGLVMILVWGLAYLGAAFVKSEIKWLAGVFAIEKLVYVVVWVKWIMGNSLSELYSRDLLAGIFYTLYGPNDLLFMVFFAWIFFAQSNPQNSTRSTESLS